ncbi:NAD-dependent epimerase/dehydratase family protein [Photobacterium damselae]|nr:NAD-dependent epimerase/dehydratase family protein [Photobacterium damselae]
MNSNILIVGGSGFIAHHIIFKLIKHGHNVIVYGRRKPNIKHSNLMFIEGELNEIADKLAYMKCEFHNSIYLVNNITVNDDRFDNDFQNELSNNKKALSDIFKISKRVVFFSSGGRIYKDSDQKHTEDEELSASCFYGKSKIELEQFVINKSIEYDKDYLIIRPSNPYGKYQNINSNQGLIAISVSNILNKRPVEIWGDGDEIRDYIYIDDFVTLFYKLLIKGKLKYNIYNISSGVGYSTREIINTIHCNISFDFNIIYRSVSFKLIKKNILSNERVIKEVGELSFVGISDGISRYLKEYL